MLFFSHAQHMRREVGAQCMWSSGFVVLGKLRGKKESVASNLCFFLREAVCIDSVILLVLVLAIAFFRSFRHCDFQAQARMQDFIVASRAKGRSCLDIRERHAG